MAAILPWAEWICLLGALGAFTITEEYRPYVSVGLGLLAVAFALRALRTRHLIPHTGLGLPGLLFLLSGGVATWVAYDQPIALLQFARILAAAVLFFAVVESSPRLKPWIGAGLVGMAAFLAVYWPLQYDFAAGMAKIGLIQSLGMWLNAHVPALPGPTIHPNVGAGAMALALPFAAALTWDTFKQRRRGLAILGGILSLSIVAGLVLTTSRGAWVGVLVALGLACLAWVQRRWFSRGAKPAWFWGVAILLALILVGTLAATGLLERALGSLPDPTGTLFGRLRLWEQSLPLLRDYLFTGSGLMTFRMVHTFYCMMTHAPYFDHLHNTYLEVALEQGLFGLLGLVGMLLAAAIWAWRALRSEQVSPWAWAGLAGLAIFAVHGIFDAVLYVTRTLPLVGLVLAFAFQPAPVGRGVANARRLRIAVVASALSVIALAAIFHRPLTSAFYANLGAVAQTRSELPVYLSRNFNEQTPDEARLAADLSLAQAHFLRALAWNAENPTALQRLAGIALSLGEYDSATDWVRTAWEAGYRDEVTRLLWGDVLAANGQPESAAEAVRGIRVAEGRLMFQAFYRYERHGDLVRAADAWRAVLTLNPDNLSASNWLAQHTEGTTP